MCKSSRFDGELGGLSGADSHCQAVAQAGASTKDIKNGVWKAFLNTNTQSVASRISVAPGSTIKNTRGEILFQNGSSLFGFANIQNPIYTQTGSPVGFNSVMWTNAVQLFDCNGWTSNSAGPAAVTGRPNSLSGWWIGGGQACDYFHQGVYCINSNQ